MLQKPQQDVKDDLLTFQNEDSLTLTIANKIDLIDKNTMIGDLKITAHSSSDVETVKREILNAFNRLQIITKELYLLTTDT